MLDRQKLFYKLEIFLFRNLQGLHRWCFLNNRGEMYQLIIIVDGRRHRQQFETLKEAKEAQFSIEEFANFVGIAYSSKVEYNDGSGWQIV